MSVVELLAARLVAAGVIVVLLAAIVFAPCDFDDSPCDDARIVADTKVVPGIIADRTEPTRATADDDAAAGSGGADGHSGAWWVTNRPPYAAPDQLPGIARYSRLATADPRSLAGNPPGHPPKA